MADNREAASETRKKRHFGGRWYQYYSAIAGLTTVFDVGMILSWTSPILLVFEQGDPTIKNVTTIEATWIASAPAIGALFTSLPSGLVVNYVGRKHMLIVGALLAVLAWAIMVLAKNALVVIIGRVFCGFSFSITLQFCSVYVAEIVETKVRGAFCSVMAVMMNLGQLAVFCYGPFVSYFYNCVIGLILAVVILILLLLTPETPYHYLLNEKEEKAEKSFRRIRPADKPAETDAEFRDMKAYIAAALVTRTGFYGSMKEVFTNRSNRHAFYTVNWLLVFNQFSGLSVICAYQAVIYSLSGFELDPNISAIISSSLRLIASITAALTIDRFGRKPLMYVSSLGSFLSHLISALFFLLQYLEYDVSAYSWAPLVGITLYSILFSFGLGTVPWVLLAELFGMKARGFAVSIVATLSNVYFFIILVVFISLSANSFTFIGFLLLALASAGAFVFTYCYLIETKGKTFAEISQALNW